MEKGPKRSQRRFNTKRIQKKRWKKWKDLAWVIDDPRKLGKLKKHHFGCGCTICKPHKWGLDDPFKNSEMRRLQDDGEAEEETSTVDDSTEE